MADFRVRRIGVGHPKMRSVSVAVTAEGFWCCPSLAAIPNTLKNQIHQNKEKTSSAAGPPSQNRSNQKTSNHQPDRKPSNNLSGPIGSSDDQNHVKSNASDLIPPPAVDEKTKVTAEKLQQKISVQFGQPETSDMKIFLFGKDENFVRMRVHKDVLERHSSLFAEKISTKSNISCAEIRDCDELENYVEVIGLMYCKDIKQRLIGQSVSRVLCILKIAESLGFDQCIKSCLDYLEATPWLGEEEENVVSSVQHLQNNTEVSSILRRVSVDVSNYSNDTISHIIQLVLKSNEDRARREMKTMVSKLLKEDKLLRNDSKDLFVEILYGSCRRCLDTLLLLFRQANGPGFTEKRSESGESIFRKIALEADNLLWLVEIMADKHVADDFASMWAGQDELVLLHSKLPVISRHLISCVAARLFVGIGRGEILPSKDTRQLLLKVWLQPLIEDYNWLHHGTRSFDRNAVEEGIGQTILTLPLEDQQSMLLSWLSTFLKVGDKCPNLQRAFEVWWRRTFIRPYSNQSGSGRHS